MLKLIIGIIYIVTIILYCAILVKKKIKDTSTYINFGILILVLYSLYTEAIFSKYLININNMTDSNDFRLHT